LNKLSEAFDAGELGISKRYEELKDEFKGLLFEMRRRKSIAEHGANILINIEVFSIFKYLSIYFTIH
jgi:hypothetical protein